MTITIIILIVFMVVWAFIMGCCELEHREDDWWSNHPPKGGSENGESEHRKTD